MAIHNLYIYGLIALLAVNLILADSSEQHQERAGPPFNPFESFGSNPFSFLPFGFNPFGFNFSQFLPFDFSNSRQTRDLSSQESNETDSPTEPNHRMFFSLGSRLTTCNYTETPGLSCANCYQALTCLSSNVGISRRCKFYCNSGRCSFVPGSQCSSSNNSTS